MPDIINQNVVIEGEGNIVVGKGDVVINPIPPAEARLRRDLGILLKNVENTWVKGVLEKSVHNAALLDLGMELREEAVDNPWRMVIEKPDQSREELPQGSEVKDIFDEANRLLLILGEPGSGKTTTLLQLARDLIAEVDEAFTQPVPVILNLSTWIDKQQKLDEWLIAELNSKYRLPKKDGKNWLTDRRILPLLDGLDEVRVENRAACVENINQLMDDYGLHGLVVCSRVKDYTELDVRLAFYRAIYLQPLTPEQVDEYLNKAGDKLANLRATLQSDESLQEMAQSPLILNIMSLAYQNTNAESLSTSSLNTKEARIKHLFDTYIARMFNRKVGAQEYDTQQIKHRLSWLAWNMKMHNQDIFLIESLQPNWIPVFRWRIVYTLLSSFLLIMLTLALFFGLAGGYLFWLVDGENNGLIVGMISGSIIGLALGLVITLASVVVEILRIRWFDSWLNRKKPSNLLSSSINIASVVLIFGLGFGLIGGFVGILFNELIDGLKIGLIFGLLLGLIGGVSHEISERSLISKTNRNIQRGEILTVDVLQWNWSKVIKIVPVLVLIGGLLGVLIGSLYFGLAIGLFSGVLLTGFIGLNREILETKTIPNQGIDLSARNAIYGGLIVGLNSGLFMGLISGLIGDPLTGLVSGLFIGLMFALAGALIYGGIYVVAHYSLRLILIIQGYTPRNYARFLDYAVDLIFLQKVGGGYRFIHRMLLEHFANMQEAQDST